jgi:acyl-CoA reductase-like NAD-dependent aldehyde dehydrogenase
MERRALLHEFANRLESYKDDLTEVLAKETGKTMEFAAGEIMMGIATIKGNGKFGLTVMHSDMSS